jgi:hypothetical protein
VIAQLYADFVDAVIVDPADAALAERDPRLIVAPTIMHTAAQKIGLARECIAAIGALGASGGAFSRKP